MGGAGLPGLSSSSAMSSRRLATSDMDDGRSSGWSRTQSMICFDSSGWMLASRSWGATGGRTMLVSRAPVKRVSRSSFGGTTRAVTFHLENGYPGYYGISLNDEGQIMEFSLFIKGDMCPNGTDRRCARNVKTLGTDFQ